MVENASNDYFWTHGINRTNVNIMTTIVVFCGTETIYRVLRATGCNSRLLVASGGIIPVMFPIGAVHPLHLVWDQVVQMQCIGDM